MSVLLFWLPAVSNAGNTPQQQLPVSARTGIHFLQHGHLLKDSTDILKQETEQDQDFSQLTGIIEFNVEDREDRKEMMRFLRILKVKKALRKESYKARLYKDLANISARLKLYPLTMQLCQYEMLAKKSEADTGHHENIIYKTASPAAVPGTTELAVRSYYNNESEPVTTGEILRAFEDNKEASDYALILHVKQPVHKKRNTFAGIDNVGHMFVTLIKYNTDKTFVSRSFGFYPDKNSLLTATPLKPTAPSTFKDDSLHEWDEAIGKFISQRRFMKIIRLLAKYEYKMYNLNENNCTDFGLAIASLSGIDIKETTGSWPLGKGNNPAITGQSILEDKVLDEDAANNEGVFIFKK
ncbi:MAG: hypothetical protein QM791_15010 [Ferruginibacter sp.]